METDFVWTDEAVKSFTQVYSSNFNSKWVHFKVDPNNYWGKKLNVKLEQFKIDYKPKQTVWHVKIKMESA